MSLGEYRTPCVAKMDPTYLSEHLKQLHAAATHAIQTCNVHTSRRTRLPPSSTVSPHSRSDVAIACPTNTLTLTPTPTPTPRLVNGEGDRLSGLVVDVFAGVIGVSSSAVWVEAFRPEIEAALGQVFGAEATKVIWRRSDGRLQQDGWKGNNKPVAAAEEAAAVAGDDEGAEAGRENPGGGSEEAGEGEGAKGEERRPRSDAPATVVRELGLDYLVRPQFGQKTGVPRWVKKEREQLF